MSAESEAKSAAHGGKELFEESMKIVADVFAPIAGAVVGYVAGNAIGGPQSLANVVWNLLPKGNQTGTSATWIRLLVALIFDVAFGAAALSLWRAGRGMAVLGRAVARFGAGFLGGYAVYASASPIQNKNWPGGAVFDAAVAGV